MPYTLLAKFSGIILAATLIFGAGYATSWKSSQVQIGALKGAIQAANAMSAKVLSDKQKQVADATSSALKLNKELDSAREKAIETINSYHDQLATSRLRDPNNKSGCTDPLSSGSNTGSGQANAANGADVSEELARLLRTESERADSCAVDKNLLLDFVNGNCGIAK